MESSTTGNRRFDLPTGCSVVPVARMLHFPYLRKIQRSLIQKVDISIHAMFAGALGRASLVDSVACVLKTVYALLNV